MRLCFYACHFCNAFDKVHFEKTNILALIMKYSLLALLCLSVVTGCNTLAGIGDDLSTLGRGMKGFGSNTSDTAPAAAPATKPVTKTTDPTAVESDGTAYTGTDEITRSDAYSPNASGQSGFNFDIREYD
jgi:predicted small secreted protein